MSSSSPSITAALLPPNAKALVFDCDGTLIDSMGYHYEVWREACDKFGIKITAATMLELAGKPITELFDILCQRSNVTTVDRDTFFAYKNTLYAKSARKCPVIEPVMQIVYAGKERGLPMAVASGGTHHHVNKGLTENGILDLFDAIVCGEDVKNGKPAPDAFLLAAEKLGVDPKFCVGYEDAKLGMQAIQAAGYLAAVDVTTLPGYPRLVDN